MSDPRVCHHGGLRRQCEACDVAERLAVAVKLLRSVLDEGTPWLDHTACRYCGNGYLAGHHEACAWGVARVFVESEV